MEVIIFNLKFEIVCNFKDGGHVINVGQHPSFHLLNSINTKHQETLQKNKNNYKKNIKTPSTFSKKNQSNSNNRPESHNKTINIKNKKQTKFYPVK